MSTESAFRADPNSPMTQRRFAHNIEWKVLGPMPVEEFIDEFFPLPPNSPDTNTQLRNAGVDYNDIDFTSIPESPGKEEHMYPGICDNLNKIAYAKELTFRNASRSAEWQRRPEAVKPDIGLFHINDENKDHLFTTKKMVGGKRVYTARMGLVYLFVDVKKGADQDIFTDPPDDLTDLPDDDTGYPDDGTYPPEDAPPDYKFTVDTWSRERNLEDKISALEQITHYAHVVQSRQFRTCVFSLAISGSTVRIMRWDRSGVLVTRSFDYRSEPGLLIKFVWRFVSAPQVQQGFDLTAFSRVPEQERDLFLEAVRSHVQLQLALGPKTPAKNLDSHVDIHHNPGVITRLVVEGRSFLVSRPLRVSTAVTGRCTVCFWGVDCDTKQVVFVKDVWRTNVEGVEQEGQILKRLREKEVGYIPSPVCHGDVTDQEIVQTTHTDRFVDKPWVNSLHLEQPELKRFIPRVHYRLVTDTAGYPLSSFKGSRELLDATYHTFTAVMDANEKAETLHQDVSLSNIILYRPREGEARVGCLVDWELAAMLGSIKPRNALIGTPAFMSISALSVRGHVHELGDDLESIIYVVLYAALRWLPVDSPHGRLFWWFDSFFGAPDPYGFGGGGDHKFVNATHRKYSPRLKSTRSTQVLQWLKNAMDLHYKNGIPNPAWKDGKALKKMWTECCAEELPHDDRREKVIPGIGSGRSHSLHATYTDQTSSPPFYPTKTVPAKRSQGTGSSQSRKIPRSKPA